MLTNLTLRIQFMNSSRLLRRARLGPTNVFCFLPIGGQIDYVDAGVHPKPEQLRSFPITYKREAETIGDFQAKW